MDPEVRAAAKAWLSMLTTRSCSYRCSSQRSRAYRTARASRNMMSVVTKAMRKLTSQS